MSGSGEKSLLHIAAVNTKSNSSLFIEDQQLARWYDLDKRRTFDGEKQKKISNLRKQVHREGGAVEGEPANSVKKALQESKQGSQVADCLVEAEQQEAIEEL